MVASLITSVEIVGTIFYMHKNVHRYLIKLLVFTNLYKTSKFFLKFYINKKIFLYPYKSNMPLSKNSRFYRLPNQKVQLHQVTPKSQLPL